MNLDELTENYVIIPVKIISDIENETSITENLSFFPLSSEFRTEIIKSIGPIDPDSDISDIHEANYYFKFKAQFKEATKIHNFLNALDKTLRLINLGSSGHICAKQGISWACTPVTSKIEPIILKETTLNQNDLNDFIKLLAKIEQKIKDNKFDLMMYNYFLASTGMFLLHFEARFIALMIVLEMLYLNKNEYTKGTIIDARIRKILNMNEDVKSLYDLRNDLVHDGQSTNLTDKNFRILADITRKSLLLYLEKPEQFESKSLKEIYEPEKKDRKCIKHRNKNCNDCHCEVQL